MQAGSRVFGKNIKKRQVECMKKILVDVRFSFGISVSAGKFNGGNNYSIHTLSLLSERSELDVCILCRKGTKEVLKERLGDGIKYKEIDSLCDLEKADGEILFIPLVEDTLEYAKELARFHCKLPHIKIYTTIHDRRYKELKSDKYNKYYYDGLKANRLIFCLGRALLTRKRDKAIKRIARISDVVFTVSNYSMQSLNRIAGIKEILYLFLAKTDIGVVSPQEERGKHILFVSGGRCEKNLVRALLAYDGYVKKSEGKALPLIVTGVNESRKSKFMKLKQVSDETWAHVTFLGYVENQDLDLLYKTCRFLLFPSRNEGFGLPVLEAALRFKPSVVSSLSAVPEVISAVGIGVDPYSVSSIEKGIERMANEEEYKIRCEYLCQKREILIKQIALDERIFLGYFLD